LRAIALLLSVMLWMAGCAQNRAAQVNGLSKPVAVQQAPWSYQGTAGHVLTTDHYRIYTTVSPDETLFETLPQLMEGAYTQYRRLAGNVVHNGKPLDCYVFGQRSQWVEFTRRQTGPRASLYLQISVGAYAIGDVFVAYDIGDYRTLYTAAHEGWHQFASRYFKGELPRFLEEGMATQFENVDAFHGLPKWKLETNSNRAQGLRRSIEGKFLFSLAELMTLHAGQVVHRPGDRIDAFYSQCWAFIRFLRDGEQGMYRPAFDRLLADVAAGTVWGLTDGRGWTADNTVTILTHYLGAPLDQLDREFIAYCNQIAFRDYMQQWQ
jgi:hypothetical protein